MAEMPRMNLSPEATPWGRAMQERVSTLESQLRALRQDTDNSLRVANSTLGNLGSTVRVLQATSDIRYSEFNANLTGFTGWYSGALPSVSLSSPTGSIEIGYGGALNGGDGYFCYSVVGDVSGTIVSRDSILSSPARRVAVTGGASFAPSGWHTMVIGVPPDEMVTISLQINVSSTFVTVFGGSIYARATP